VNCPVCRLREAEVGVLCEECRDDLASPINITPEQIQARSASPTGAVLVDLWGRPHRLATQMQIGRHVDGAGVAILEPSVSRNHAEIMQLGGAWAVRDLGSANGTYSDDHLIDAPTPIKTGDRLRFGHITFYFLDDAEALPIPALARTMTATIRPRAAEDFRNDDERTDVGLPTMEFRLHEPTGGGGGLIEVNNKQVQLTATQFELMALMIRRMAAESHQPDLVRGFVRSSELIADLSWDTREPSENHVKQLVRRVRRALIKAEIGDLIESRHRFGYRLRAIPRG
jgi:hypothetical protein